jgi:profilin
MQAVVGAFKDTGTPKKVQMEGIHVAGQKYFVLKADEGSIYGKQVSYTFTNLHEGDW